MHVQVGRELTCRVYVEFFCVIVGSTHTFIPKELFQCGKVGLLDLVFENFEP